MPNPGSTVDASPTASASEDSLPEDGWRSNGQSHAINPTAGHQGVDLAALRAELDRIDNTVHDLLIERAKVVEQVALAGKPAAFRPGREASIVRRLVGRHRGSLPPASLFRIWRELLAGTTAMQGGFSLAVCDADPGAALTQLAREHFGALTPLRRYNDATQLLTDLGGGTVPAAVLPFPSDAATWWTDLLRHQPRLHVIGRLPFWRDRPEGAPSTEALVVALAPPDPSADDRSFVGLEFRGAVTRAQVSQAMTAAGLAPDMMLLQVEPSASTTYVLVEVSGFLADDDDRLSHPGLAVGRPIVVGSYAVPFPETR